jgi:hypothetical protein
LTRREYALGALGAALGNAGHSRRQQALRQARHRQGNRREGLEIILRRAETFITQSKGFY